MSYRPLLHVEALPPLRRGTPECHGFNSWPPQHTGVPTLSLTATQSEFLGHGILLVYVTASTDCIA